MIAGHIGFVHYLKSGRLTAHVDLISVVQGVAHPQVPDHDGVDYCVVRKRELFGMPLRYGASRVPIIICDAEKIALS